MHDELKELYMSTCGVFARLARSLRLACPTISLEMFGFDIDLSVFDMPDKKRMYILQAMQVGVGAVCSAALVAYCMCVVIVWCDCGATDCSKAQHTSSCMLQISAACVHNPIMTAHRFRIVDEGC